MTATPKRLSVVVVTYNSGEVLDRFLDSLASATSARLDVTVCDNDSSDGSPEAIASRPEVTVIQNGANLGYGRAVNVGMARSQGDFVLVANPDIVFGPAGVDELLAATGRWPKAASLGPLIYTPEGKVYPSARMLPSLGRGTGHALFGWWWPANPWTAAYRREHADLAEGPAEWLSGACLLLRRDAFESIGGFDPAYFMYFEDLDLGERLGRAGWSNVFVPTASVTHLGGHSTAQNRTPMAVAHHRSAYLYLSRRYCGWRWLPVRVALRIGLTARSLAARRIRSVAAGAEPQRPVGARLDDSKGAADGPAGS